MRNSHGAAPLGVALIGSGRMGSFHAETLARRLPGARLAAVADAAPGAADRLVGALGAGRAYRDAAQLWDDPDVDAVVIATPARTPTSWSPRPGPARPCSARSRWPSPWPTPTGPSMPRVPPAWCCRSASTGGSRPTGPRPGS